MGRLLMREEKRHFIIHPIGTSIGANSHMSCTHKCMNEQSTINTLKKEKERMKGCRENTVVPEQRSKFRKTLIENNESVVERKRTRGVGVLRRKKKTRTMTHQIHIFFSQDASFGRRDICYAPKLSLTLYSTL